jgi:hypothetical protein
MLNHILSRWKRSRSPSPLQASTLRGGSSHGLGAGTTTLKPRGQDSLLQSLIRLLPGDAESRSRPMGPAMLAGLRAEFEAALSEVSGAQELRRSIQRARSLDDFWHLRGWLFTELARAHSQGEAASRLARLNNHFADPLDDFFLQGPNRRQ